MNTKDPAAAVKKQFPVTGMSCASCAASVENILSAQQGILHARVNFANNSAQIEYAPTITTPGQMKIALQEVGYDMVIDETEEATEALQNANKRHFTQLRSKTIGAIVLSLPIVIIGMFFMDLPYANFLMWILATPIVAWLGRQFFINAYNQARHRAANMDTLVALSTGIAYLFSVFNTLVPSFWQSRGVAPMFILRPPALSSPSSCWEKCSKKKPKPIPPPPLKSSWGCNPRQ